MVGVVYKTREKQNVNRRVHDIGTPERHKKGDVQAYKPRDEKSKVYAHALSQLELYESRGFIDESQAKAGSALYVHWWYGVMPEAPRIKIATLADSRGSFVGLNPAERMMHHKERYYSAIKQLTPAQRVLIEHVCIYQYPLSRLEKATQSQRINGVRKTSKLANDFIGGLDVLVEFFGC